MSSLEALIFAIDTAVRKRDEARNILRERQSAYEAAQSQMEQLSSYALEMGQRWGAEEGAMFKPEIMLHYNQFMSRLQHAVNMQTKIVADQGIRLEVAQKALMAAELRLSSLNKVVEARQRDINLAQMRREQKQTDERAAMQFIGSTFGMKFEEV